MPLQRLLTNVLSDNLDTSKQFYIALFDLSISFENDWFVHLRSGNLELGILDKGHDIVPEDAKGNSSGHYLTFVVDDLEKVKSTAVKRNFEIIQHPQPTPYGQLRMLLVAPEGTVCDVSMPS